MGGEATRVPYVSVREHGDRNTTKVPCVSVREHGDRDATKVPCVSDREHGDRDTTRTWRQRYDQSPLCKCQRARRQGERRPEPLE